MNKKLIKKTLWFNPLLKKTVRKMKATTFFLIVIGTGLFAAESHSQTSKVNIMAQNVSVKEVLREIEKQTDYLFIYNPNEVNLEQTTSVQAKEKTVTDVLADVFNKSEVVYLIEENSIMLMKRPEAQQPDRKRISGVVTDEKGEAIIGANIIGKGGVTDANGTITDVDGKFMLEVSPGATLIVSFIGYITQEIAVGNQNSLKITLVEDITALGEVIVVGYGSRTKGALTGSVAKTDSKIFETRPITNTASALQGAMPGVTVIRGATRPGGDEIELQVRGYSSMSGHMDTKRGR
jgi:hypothetical protein